MENVDMFNAATAPLTFHDFLDRMRHPQAVDLVKSIKSFIVDFMSRTPDAEKDSESVQAFLTVTEGAFEAHPLFVNATDEELESAGEGLEKYLMTKLFVRAFAPFPEEVEHDQRLTEKMAMLQQFIRPEHLDIPPSFHESSWLLAQKELQKINTYKAPRDKLVCILNCCRVINNLLLNVSIGSKDNPPGADDFLPVLIYVVIKANPPQLHSNLLYITRYRHHSRLVSEAAYFYTNLVSAQYFIDNLEATSLSMDSSEFEKQMQSARALLDVNLLAQPSVTEKHPPASAMRSDEHVSPPVLKRSGNKVEPGPGLSVRREDQVESRVLPVESASLAATVGSVPVSPKEDLSEKDSMTFARLETSGLPAVLEADRSGELARDYPYLYASAGDLRVMDVEGLLSDYKEIVLKYVALYKAVQVEGAHGVTGVGRVSSPLLDLREISGKSQSAGEIRRTKESNSPTERLVLGEDRAVVKEEERDVKTTADTEGVVDLFEGMSLLNTSIANNPHSPSFRDIASQGRSPNESPRETDDQGSNGHHEDVGRSDEHRVAEDTGEATREVIKVQDS